MKRSLPCLYYFPPFRTIIHIFKYSPVSTIVFLLSAYFVSYRRISDLFSPVTKCKNVVIPALIQTTTPTRPQEDFSTIYRFPQTPCVYNPPKQTIPRININVNSGVNPKKPPHVPSATRTDVFPKPTISSSYLPLPPPPSPKLRPPSSSPFNEISGSPKSSSVSTKPILARAASTPTSNQTKSQYNVVEKGSTPLYVIPEDIKSLIRKDIVPGILKKPLSPQTYKNYFAALLYAEDYYLEKWDGFEMKNVTLNLQEAEIHGKKDKFKNKKKNQKDEKSFVEFEVDTIPEKRPFLLSRDFASVRPSGRKGDPFQGIIFRVVRSNIVLVEFGDDFHAQHYSSCKYDVKFSFNRVCLKRAHQAIAAASDILFTNFLFPEYRPNDSYFSKKVSFTEKVLFSSRKLNSTAISRIINLNGSPAYLVEGPLSVTRDKALSTTGIVLRDAVVQLSQASSHNKILICAPTNSTCDVFMRNLWKEIGDSNIFRANAAFRELDGVPFDILPFCPYKKKEEVFSCPSLSQLRKFKVILSTFMSSFRLHNEGIERGHFTHIILVDASSAIEPEILVPLTNLADVSTNVVVTGAPRNNSNWIRSDIARQNGLKTSYFERLRESKLYRDLNPECITQLEDGSNSSSSNFR
ncbi:RNA helicase [Heracleum sosnowskyi]|uniref:RNA helicase n=1 Tax=Heracleum sosnowskyi TaxID=360622 RepID=A0AAD8N0B9_9APIA|nr:RNA helicase [Heracleum sosnowskyi]